MAEDKCNCCGATLPGADAIVGKDRLSGVPGEFSVRICPDCGSGTTFPVVDEAGLADFYDSEYNPHEDWQPPNRLLATVSKAIRGFIHRRAMRSLPLSALPSTPGSALDVGCGRGDLGATLISLGWNASGVEPSPDAAEAARRKGVDTQTGTLGGADFGDRSFDLIVFQHSLEHVVDPSADIARVSELLSPGGLLFVSVPNFGCLQRKLFRGRWFHLDLPRHRFHYTDAGLRRLAEKSGLSVTTTGTSSTPVGLPGSLSYAVFGRWIFKGPLITRIATLASLILYLPALAVNAFGGGDVLHLVARKPEQ